MIVGIDEAGRGALAGGIFAGAVADDKNLKSVNEQLKGLIGDSKKMTEKQREQAFEAICNTCFWGWGSSSSEEVDQLGVKKATQLAMTRAIEILEQKKCSIASLLIDGRDGFGFDYPSTDIVKGDEKEPCISAASIIAKVLRDRDMIALDKVFPVYGFSSHKGYGAASHTQTMKTHGHCKAHRITYDPLRTWLTQSQMEF